MSDMVPEVLNAALDSLFTPKEPGEPSQPCFSSPFFVSKMYVFLYDFQSAFDQQNQSLMRKNRGTVSMFG